MSASARKPARFAFSVLVSLGVYPLVTTLSYASQPLTAHWAIWQRNLLVVPVMVLAMTYVLIPAIHALLSRFDTTQ